MKGALLMMAASLVLSPFVSQFAAAGEFVVTKLEDKKAEEVYDVLDKNLEKSEKPGYDVDEIIFAKKNKITGVQDDAASVIYKKKIGADPWMEPQPPRGAGHSSPSGISSPRSPEARISSITCSTFILWPFSVLQSLHETTTFFFVDLPPRATGTRWSIVRSSFENFLPQ